MKNYSLNYKLHLSVLISGFLFLGCTEDSTQENNQLENSQTSSLTESLIDFDNLLVETTWDTEDIKDKVVYLANEVDGEKWMDVYNSGLVRLKCLEGKSHRTELKEDKGDENSLSFFKEMNYTATLTSIPEEGVTIAQIHNRGGVERPWIRIFVDDDNFIKIKTTNTCPTCEDSDDSDYSEYEGPLYTSGSDFSVAIKTEKGKAKITITTDGETYSNTLTPEEDWADFSDDFYLKAGVYTEGYDKQPQLKFSSFSISH